MLVRSSRRRGEHRRLANPCFAANDEGSTMVREPIDDPIETFELVVSPDE
jgi:predicted metalloenzyme YecM